MRVRERKRDGERRAWGCGVVGGGGVRGGEKERKISTTRGIPTRASAELVAASRVPQYTEGIRWFIGFPLDVVEQRTEEKENEWRRRTMRGIKGEERKG